MKETLTSSDSQQNTACAKQTPQTSDVSYPSSYPSYFETAQIDEFIPYHIEYADEIAKEIEENERILASETGQRESYTNDGNTPNGTNKTEETAVILTSSSDTVIEQPTLDTLTEEIRVYLALANQSVIEVGKRLQQAKDLLPHGQWGLWLKSNFNLSQSMAIDTPHA